MSKRHPPLPRIWLISDARNDAVLERALERLPRGAGFVFRHYHLDPKTRRARFGRLRRIARARGHVVILAGTRREAARWRADGAYGASAAGRFSGLGQEGRIVLATAHSFREIGRIGGADAILVSPVFPTRSHPGARTLGPLRFRLLARHARVPVIALGGMTAGRARSLGSAWAAIDGLSSHERRISVRISMDS